MKEIIKKTVILVLAAIIVYVAYHGFSFWKEYNGKGQLKGKDVTVTIEQGSGVNQIAHVMKENGLISYEKAFVLRAKKDGYQNKLRYGTFELNNGMSVRVLLEELSKNGAQAEGITITIPEGYSVEMIAAKLQKEGICSAEEFLNAVNQEEFSYDFLKEIPENNQINYRLQGFLYPDTYTIAKDATVHEIIDTMLARFDEQFDYAAYKKKASDIGYSVYDVMTMASMVEREAKVKSEQKTIAGVFYNRLKQNMKMEIDATTIYAMSDGMYDVKRVYYRDLEIQSPYNTYYCDGLPVGPICNPGIDAIKAAFAPEKHDYLYYHTIGDDGEHIFTKTFDEHVNTLEK